MYKELTLEGSWRDPGFTQGGSHPVVCVAWNAADAYVQWLAKKSGRPYRLLSEAEVEYAARARTTPGDYPSFWFGNDEKDVCRSANSRAPWCRDGYEYTAPAGHYPPNAFGLFDMAGNAWQWLADCYHTNYKGAPTDGSAWTGCNGHVIHGGSWFDTASVLGATGRTVGANGSGDNSDGFRVARTLIPD